MVDLICRQQENRFRHRWITPADKGKWPNITEKDAGVLFDSHVYLGSTQGKSVPVKYAAVVFGNIEMMPSQYPLIKISVRKL